MNTVTASTPMREDIQVLRALAVLLVVFYHAGIDWLGAGYLGVDIFFVISGYLITGLIARQIGAGQFSFGQFYYRRAKRLLPPAYVVTAATVALAPFFVTDIVLEEMKAQVLGVVTFTSNFVLWSQSGYFDAAAEAKPFLHFWSLAIEEQYYLIMPLLLVFVPRRYWLWMIGMGLLASLVGGLWLATVDAASAFYLLPTRAWELALGSLGALAGLEKRFARVLPWLRWPALCILLGIPAFPTGLPHPGLDAILVCCATLIILVQPRKLAGPADMGRPAWMRGALRVLGRIGDVSYSLYLVHWPVFVFTRAAWLEEPPQTVLLAMLGVSLALSFAIFHLVETPFRRGFARAVLPVTAGLVLTTGALALTPLVQLRPSADTPDFKQIRRANLGLARACAFGKKYTFEGTLSDTCRSTPEASVLVWGDSYAMAYVTALLEPLKTQGVEQATAAACDPVLGIARFPIEAHTRYTRAYARDCIALHKAILSYATQRDALEIVVLAARFETILLDDNMLLVQGEDGYQEHPPTPARVAQGLAAMAMTLRAAGKKVVFLAPPPADGRNIGACLERRARGQVTFGLASDCRLDFADVQAKRAITWEMLALASKQSDTPVLSLRDFLCDGQYCTTQIDGTFLYRDAGHLTVDGARLIGARSDLARQILTRAR